MSDKPGVSVLIPTWRRPAELGRCLRAVCGQTRRPGQVVVTVRRDDLATWEALESLGREGAFCGVTVDTVAVEPCPLTAAMNAGLARTTGDWVALTDDDSEPRTDWLERMSGYFDVAAIGGVGGRDWQPRDRGDVHGARRVGCVSWFGRTSANHHLGAGPARDVDVLKGVNCCFRGDLLRKIGFDTRLRGKGNVSHWEMSLCFKLRRRGYRLVYDPAIATDHHVAARHDGDSNARGTFTEAPFVDGVHNETLALLEHLSPAGRAAFRAWAAAVGTRAAPGLLQVLRLGLQRSDLAGEWRRFQATMAGRRAGRETWRASRRQDAASPAEAVASPPEPAC